MNKVDKNRPVSSIIITTMRIILTICKKRRRMFENKKIMFIFAK